ncbi:MAG: TIGR03663 family protein [Kiritimatiellae bacterium]|nr:TIGR03663 family protein [Kiritimatiellia bacterium]
MNRLVIAIWLAMICLAAGALRWHRLDRRPMHTDEAVQAVKTGHLLETGVYRYDPREYHGPTLYYLAALAARLAGIVRFEDLSERQLRSVTAVFGVATIALSWLLYPPLRRSGLLIAALLMAAQPFLVFYSGYFIQETLLVAFTAGLVGALWRYLRSPAAGWAVLGGLFGGLMAATKETFVITLAAIAAGLGAAMIGGLRLPGGTEPRAVARHAAVAAAVALAVAAAWFSSWFTHPAGVADAVRAFAHFAERAGGQGHEKPWWYHLRLLFAHRAGPLGIWSQWPPVVLAVAGGLLALRPRFRAEPVRPFLVFGTVFNASLLGIYSAIPYKTPWLTLTAVWGLCVLGGAAAQLIWNLGVTRRWPRWTVALLLAAGLADAGRQLRWMKTTLAADPRNPCVYEHTSTDLLNGVRLVHEAAEVVPAGHDLLIAVVAEEYWPLPWYLRRFPNVGYWSAPPADLPRPPDVVIATPATAAAVDAWLDGPQVKSTFGLRPTTAILIYLPQPIWTAVLERRNAAAAPR